MREKEKVWLIIDGTEGLGLCLIRKLLAAGEKVAATATDISLLMVAVNSPLTSTFLPLAAGMDSDQSIPAIITATVNYFGRINIVVNCANDDLLGMLEDVTTEEIGKCFQVNLFSAISLIEQIIPVFRAQLTGHIFNISSIEAILKFPGRTVFSAAKLAVLGFSESISDELSPLGIRITTIVPDELQISLIQQIKLETAADVMISTAGNAHAPRYLLAENNLYTAYDSLEEINGTLNW